MAGGQSAFAYRSVTPLQFETQHSAQWAQLEELLDRKADPDVTELTWLYRQVCEQLALVRARDYPVHLVERLNMLTARAHQEIYRQSDFGFDQLRRWLLLDFPHAVRSNVRYVALAALLFSLPALLLGVAVYFKPDLLLSIVDANTAWSYEQMYSPSAHSIGRLRTAGGDWSMFGFYIMNNIGIGFQCYAGGLLLGIGSVAFLAFNGVFGGAVAGYLAARGLGGSFFPFVATHSAFELTAIILAGAAGLKIGHALIAPGRHSRKYAVRKAATEGSIIVFGAAVMLIIAAALEAFWSSALWVEPLAKYSMAGFCWLLVIGFFAWRGDAGR
jgi:uncharacterized membrane protein SpoIIM required for sporulation